MGQGGLSALTKALRLVTDVNVQQDGFERLFEILFNRALVSVEDDRKQENPIGFFRPSSLGGCGRMLYYLQRPHIEKDPLGMDYIMGQASVNAYNLTKIQESGTDRHARIQTIVQRMSELDSGFQVLDVEQVVRDAQLAGVNTEFEGWNAERTEARCRNHDLKISFQADGIFHFQNMDCLLEIKTESLYKFRQHEVPWDNHITQATCYAFGLNLSNVLFLYEDRNFCQQKYILVHITNEMKSALRSRIAGLWDLCASNTLPEKEEDKCTYCEYKKACKQNLV